MNSAIYKISPAKINLFLHVTGLLKNGYHNIQTIFELIDLHDELVFAKNNKNILNLSIKGLPLSNKNNLIVKAHALLEKVTQKRLGINITLKKNIPIGAGLGGGSSNAAITLLGLNELYNLNLKQIELKKLALSLGADVPVFIEGQTAWAEGIGEKLMPIMLPKQYYIILVPNCSIKTDVIYKAMSTEKKTPKITYAQYTFDNTHNDLEPIVIQKCLKVKKAINWLNQFSKARLTGSGCAIFAKIANLDVAHHIAHQPDIPGKIFITQSLSSKKSN